MNKTCNIIFVCLTVTTIITKAARENDPCVTPNGEEAKCITVSLCSVIFDAIHTRNESAIAFAKKSQCGHDGRNALVCCGSTAYENLDFILSIFDTPSPPTVISENATDEILKDLNSKELPDRSVCGIHTADDRIFGGERTAIDEFPWMVALEFKSKLTGQNVGVKCGGSLISKKYVLTAAHCVYDTEFELVHVRLGEWNLTSDPDCEACTPIKIVKVKDTIPHPFYTRLYKNNDIALLRLEREIEFTDVIRPICLPPENLPIPADGTLLTVSGWGLTEEGNAQSDIKLKVTVPLVSNSKCKQALTSFKIQANHMCAGGVTGKDACKGDSGGPLFRSFFDKVHGRLQWFQEGIVSRGVECGRSGYPGVYTRTSRYVAWIINNIEEND